MTRVRFHLCALALLAGAGTAAAEPLKTSYNVSLIGLPIGRASFDTTIEGDRFRVEGTIGSSGLADIFSTVKGMANAAGIIAGDRLFATSYGLDYTSNKKAYRSDVSLKRGRVVSATVAPEAKTGGENYIPVAKAQLRQVVDPLSGLMIKSRGTPQDLCKRTLPFFDGWSRLDLKLSPAGTRPFSTDGFRGDAVVCNVRVQPVSGYKATSRGVKFIQRQTLEFWFAPIGRTGIYAPIYAKVPTEIGPLTFRAATFAKS